MDEEILETQKEAEKEVREELDLANSRISSVSIWWIVNPEILFCFVKFGELKLRLYFLFSLFQLLAQIKVYGEQVDEYEKMIMKFRRKIGELNEEIQERQDEVSLKFFLNCWNLLPICEVSLKIERL